MADQLMPYVYLTVNIGGSEIPFITDAVIISWFIIAVLVLFSISVTKNLQTVPKGKQIFAEAYVGFMNNLLKEQIGHHHYKAFVPYLGTVLLYLIVANVIGLFNIFPSGYFWYELTHITAFKEYYVPLKPPTRNLNVTAALAVMTLALMFIAEFKYRGVKDFFRSFWVPTPVSGFVKLLDLVIRPLSLCLRLFGAKMGAFIVMTMILTMAPFITPVGSIYFYLFDALVQAYVFVFLTSIYIGECVEPLDHH